MARGEVGDVAPARKMKNPTGTLGGTAIQAGIGATPGTALPGTVVRAPLGPTEVAEKPAHAVT
jgi:hypothetical protein